MTSIPAKSATPHVPVATQVRIVALLFGLSAASYFCRTAISIAGPSIMKEFHVPEAQMGVVYSAFLMSYTALMTPGGWLTDRLGARLMLVGGGLGAAFFTALTPLAGTPGLGAWIGVVFAFVLVRVAFGACTAPIYPACGRIVSAWIRPEHQARALAAIVSAAGVGAALSPFAYAHIIDTLGWRSCFLFAGGATVLAVTLFQLGMPRRAARASDAAATVTAANKGEWRRLLTNRNLLLITASYFALNYFQYIFYYWIYYYFGEILKLGTAQTTIATTATFVTMAVMTPIGGFLSDQAVKRWGVKNGKRVVPVAGMILSAVLLYAGAAGWGVATTIVLLSLAVGCAMAPEGAFWSSAIAVARPGAGGATGIMNSGGNLGGMLAPMITPLIAVRYGWAAALYFASAVIFAGMLIWFFIDPSAGEAPEPIPER
jgi:ACS family glucarate transporter-like MFS transporter